MRSMTTPGWASLSFIIGSRLCPPAITLALSPASARLAAAASRLSGTM